MKELSTAVILLIFLFLSCAHNQNDWDFGNGGSELSLNGYWKFNSFLGDGSNSLDVLPKEGDVIIDNTQEELLDINGEWELSNTPLRESKCWGKDYYQRRYNTLEDSSYFRFKTGELNPGYYQHFILFPWGHHNATIVNVKHAEGHFTLPFNQRNRTNTWLSLGAFKVDNGSYIEFTSYTKGMVSADVVMLRPIEEKDYLDIQQEKIDLTKTSYDDSQWQTLKVPGHFGMINEYANYSGKAWYRTEVKFPKNWKDANDERIRIRFDGVYHVANVLCKWYLYRSTPGRIHTF